MDGQFLVELLLSICLVGALNAFLFPELLRDLLPAEVKFKLLTYYAELPKKATKGSACFDIKCNAPGKVYPRQTLIVPTGLEVEVPEGYALMLYGRSGHAAKYDVCLANCVGVIDSDYRGEIKVMLHNHSNEPFNFACCERIAQAMLVKLPNYKLTQANKLSSTERGKGGLGSTGK